jgi:hypothetical protein
MFNFWKAKGLMSMSNVIFEDELEFLNRVLNELHSKIGKSDLKHHDKELDDIYNRAFSSIFDLYVAYGGEVNYLSNMKLHTT